MAKKTLGYVQLEWTCPNCGTKNPGPQKICTSCGGPQPEDLQFEQAAHEELIKDEAEIARARAGPDIQCHYCGTRNPANAETCSQCGAALSEGTARASGQVLGAHRTGPPQKVTCPACGTPNEATAPRCVQCGASLIQPEPEPAPAQPAKAAAPKSRRGLIGGGVLVTLLLVACAAVIAFIVLSGRTEDLNGTVQSVSWTRNIALMGLVPVEHEAWHDQIPAGAIAGTCTQRHRSTQDDPAPDAREVCGTPYTVDTGTGYGEVVQDCKYEVYEDWCAYTVDEWQIVDRLTRSGSDLNPQWPGAPVLGTNRREGEREEIYRITFDTENGTYTYSTGDASLFAQCQIGSRWLLKVNAFNAVTSIEPIR